MDGHTMQPLQTVPTKKKQTHSFTTVHIRSKRKYATTWHTQKATKIYDCKWDTDANIHTQNWGAVSEKIKEPTRTVLHLHPSNNKCSERRKKKSAPSML